MAWKRVLTKKISGYSVNLGIDYDDGSFTTTTVKCRTVIEKTSSTWYDDRFACDGGVFSNWTAKDDGTGSGSWPYYREFTLSKGTTATSYSTGEFYCACTGNSYSWGNFQATKTNCGTATITAPSSAVVKKPTFNTPSVSKITDTSAYVSFSTANANNQSPWDANIDLSLSNFGAVVATKAAWNNTFTGLEPNRTYYARGNAKNDAGRGYSGVKSFTTSFTNPGAPGAPVLSYNQTEPIPKAVLKATWTKANAGSKPIAGYRIRLFKNNKEVKVIDTDSTAVTYTFGSFEDLGFAVGDVAKVGIYAYSLDWNDDKHFNGGGAASAQVFSSNTVTVISDKYIYASVNGGTFTKYKMYISQNGGSFVEVKKEKFKVI